MVMNKCLNISFWNVFIDNDEVHLILLFKDQTAKPIYSLDARGWSSSSEHKGVDGWTVTSSLGKRTSFRASSPYRLNSCSC